MGTTTAISWTDSTFNPWVGCQRVSPGCVNCYAEALDRRVGGGVDPRTGQKALRWGPEAPRTRTTAANWRKPLAWNAAAEKARKPHRVFCSSLADVFEDRPELVPWRADLFALIDRTPWLHWQLLTKRPENIRHLWPGKIDRCGSPWYNEPGNDWPNVWLGTTVEDQERAKERLPHLLAVPAAVRFVSAEPLLGWLDLTPWLAPEDFGLSNIDWVIVGGESGRMARPFDLLWASSLRDQCDGAGAAFFLKQLGDNPVQKVRAGHHGADVSRFPAELRRQEFPEVRP
jgi:protein gp37